MLSSPASAATNSKGWPSLLWQRKTDQNGFILTDVLNKQDKVVNSNRKCKNTNMYRYVNLIWQIYVIQLRLLLGGALYFQ